MERFFVWRLVSPGADEVRSSREFADRAAAEGWLATAWEDLAAEGVEEVELFEVHGRGAAAEERTLFRMSLAEG